LGDAQPEQYNTIQITQIGGIRISTIFTVFTAKRAAGMRNINKYKQKGI